MESMDANDSFEMDTRLSSRYSSLLRNTVDEVISQDPSRLYYNKSELQQFEDIECEVRIDL